MPLKGVHCVLGYVPMDQHRQCMISNPGPPCGVEPTILELMTRPSIERQESGVVFSPSSLSSCQRQIVLTSRHDYFLDVKSGYKRIRGSIVHEGLGHEPPYPGVLGVVRELRMSAPINTRHGVQTFHGKPDLVVLLGIDDSKLRVKIVDYKTVGEVRHDLIQADRKHVYQVNMYAWLVKQFLPGWLREVLGGETSYAGDHLFLNENWPLTLAEVGEVVVDELSIQYMDMSRTRSFTSKGFLYDKGKMISDKVGGRWVRRKPAEYEELELEPIHQFSSQYVESIIRKGIEDQIEAETVLAPPLEGDDARIMCPACPVRQHCYTIGRAEGYGMEAQAPYVDTQGGGDEEGQDPE